MTVPVRGGGERMASSTKTTLISNTCLCLPRPSCVSPWQHCALFPVVVETLCVCINSRPHCFSGSSLLEHLTRGCKSHQPPPPPCKENTISSFCHGNVYPRTSHIVLHSLSLNSCSCFCASFSLAPCLALSLLNELSMFGFEG